MDWISKYRPRAAARKNPGPARRKVTSPPPENHFPVPRGAGASKGDIASPREIISPFRSRVVRASTDDIATPFPPKRPKSPTGHPGALGKVPQSIPQWMFSESISAAFHPGDFPISPRLTRGRSAAARKILSPFRVVRASKGETPLPGKSFRRSAWSARRKVKSPLPGKSFPRSAWRGRVER